MYLKITLDSIEEVGHCNDKHHPGHVSHDLLHVAVGVPPNVAHADQDQPHDQPFRDGQKHKDAHGTAAGIGPPSAELIGEASVA